MIIATIVEHSCSAWFELRMFYISTLFSVMTILLCAINKGSIAGTTIVVALNYSTEMQWIQDFFVCVIDFVRKLTEVKKIFNLQRCPQEKAKGTIVVPEHWPNQGKIEFKDVELRYRPNTEVVLRKLDFTVGPGEKVGIVGRTGAGKSTISMSLTRVVELMGGKIEIDGVDISKMNIKSLRS